MQFFVYLCKEFHFYKKQHFTLRNRQNTMVTIKDKQFKLYLTADQIEEKVSALAERLNADYAGKCPLLLGTLNGAFIFAADLVRHLTFEHEIQFVKYSSYSGMNSTGKVNELIGLKEDISGRDIIVVEDIVDTGITMSQTIPYIKSKGANTVEIATLLSKPNKRTVDIDVKYCAMEIPNDFIVGYGLDYDELGRNLKDIYVVTE